MGRQHTFAFKDPNTVERAPRGRITHFLRFLDANEGQWAVLREYADYAQGKARKREYRRKYGPAGYEFTQRKNAAGGSTIYGRKVAHQLDV